MNETSGLELYVVKKNNVLLLSQYKRAASETNCSSSKYIQSG
ncbi:hypothetical protein [Bacillus toyonensis]|nr:hypothetical protein [Bacillus toyonensis]